MPNLFACNYIYLISATKSFKIDIMRKSKHILLACLLMFLSVTQLSANDNEKRLKFDFYGFVNYEMMFDTRQVVNAREGHVILYPENEKLDADGNDINAAPSFNFLIISSRFGVKIGGPDAFGAKTMAHFEGDLLGTRGDLKSLARLRHAYIKLNWEKSELLAGQSWHPMFVGACFPNTVTFAGGVPYYALNRAPQLKFTYNLGPLSIAAIALSQNDFASLGPDGASSSYIRNSVQPEVYIQTIFKKENFLIGATGGYQVLTPRIQTDSLFQTNEKMKSFQANIFSTIQFPWLTFKIQTNYGENNSHLVMLGGYGEAELLDAERGIYSYTGIHALSSWVDFETTGEKFKAGLMAGYVQNLGAKEDITGRTFARGANIANMYRIAPRFVYNSGKAQIGLEFLYDVAAYGTPDARYNVTDTKDISNLRTVLSLKYFF